MELYIKIKDGQPIDHPMLKENVQSAFPNVDLENLPEGWARFERVSCPAHGPYEVAICEYGWDNGIVKDIWTVHKMSEEQKQLKISTVRSNYIADGGFPDWVFDEERCCHVPPEPLPADMVKETAIPEPYPKTGKAYKWNIDQERWVEQKIEPVDLGLPPYPEDGKLYKWSDSQQAWVPKTNIPKPN